VLVANFPPRGLESVKAVRDILLGYADTYPVRAACITPSSATITIPR
jgi:hypothetical protein